GVFDIFDITSKLNSLVAGQNILAIQGLNGSLGSSDFLINPELHAGSTSAAPPGQPPIDFGAIEFSPDSGNQDEEYIELVNSNNIAVDLSGWQISNAVRHTFRPGTVIPAGGSLFVSPDVNAFRARGTSPTSGEARFVQGAYSGHLSSFGETVELREPDGTLNGSTAYIGAPSDAQLYLVISEVMYHPTPDSAAEYIELLNISDSVTLDLTGVKLTAGVSFDFTGSAVTSLAPGARVLVVRDMAAFTAAQGAGLPVAGVFTALSRLNNDGERVKLDDALNGTIKEFTYNDVAPWPVAADSGYSMVLIAPETNPDPDLASNWRSSALPGGNPNTSDAIAAPSDPDALLEHALGSDLGTFALAPPASGSGAGPIFSYPFRLGADGVTTRVDTSDDFITWSTATTTLISTVPQGDGFAIVTLQLDPAGPRFFVRLVVETTP
ncbi:MAG: lamin tail domain-containing protein, partial [Verrucomicrobiales bacterium]